LKIDPKNAKKSEFADFTLQGWEKEMEICGKNTTTSKFSQPI